MLRPTPTRALVGAALLLLVLAPTASAVLAPDVHAWEVPEAPPPEPEPFELVVPASGVLSSTFGPRWGRMHYGIDIGTLRELGVVAAAAGKVTHTGYLAHYAGYGKVVMVGHGERRQTLYSHLSTIRVAPGQDVEPGAWIGNAGCTGSCTGTHLHFELRIQGVPVDPLPYFVTAP